MSEKETLNIEQKLAVARMTCDAPCATLQNHKGLLMLKTPQVYPDITQSFDAMYSHIVAVLRGDNDANFT